MINFLKLNSRIKPNENILFSPFSIEVAYSLLMGGAQGKTENEIKRALGIHYIEEDKQKQEGINKEFGEVS